MPQPTEHKQPALQITFVILSRLYEKPHTLNNKIVFNTMDETHLVERGVIDVDVYLQTCRQDIREDLDITTTTKTQVATPCQPPTTTL